MLSKFPVPGDLIRVDKEWQWHLFMSWDDVRPKGASLMPGIASRYSKKINKQLYANVSGATAGIPAGSNAIGSVNPMQAGYIWAPYIPLQVTTINLNPNIPMDRGLLVIASEPPTLVFLHDGELYYVTAAKIEHIMNDFTLLSGLEEALG